MIYEMKVLLVWNKNWDKWRASQAKTGLGHEIRTILESLLYPGADLAEFLAQTERRIGSRGCRRLPLPFPTSALLGRCYKIWAVPGPGYLGSLHGTVEQLAVEVGHGSRLEQIHLLRRPRKFIISFQGRDEKNKNRYGK
jgi:hypothetical protein